MSTGEVDRAVKTIHASLMHVYYLIGEGWQDLQWLSLSLSLSCMSTGKVDRAVKALSLMDVY